MPQKAYFEIFLRSDTRTCFWQLIKWTGQSKNISKNTQQQGEMAHKTAKIVHKNKCPTITRTRTPRTTTYGF